MNYELNNLYESFMHKINRVKAGRNNPIDKIVDRTKDDFSAVKFACPQLGRYLQDKFNHGRPFTLDDAARCPLVIGDNFFPMFEKSALGKGLKEYTFNEFRFFKAGVLDIDRFSGTVPLLTEVTLPDEWTDIPPNAFNNFGNLVTVHYSDYVRKFGANCFSNDAKLRTAKIPEGTERIEKFAFQKCGSLREINFPRTLNFIGESAFYKCTSLKSVVVPAETIGNYAFATCSELESIEFLPTVKRTNESAFCNCRALKKVTVHSKIDFNKGTFYSDVGNPNTEIQIDLYVPEALKEFYSDPNLPIKSNVSHLFCY